MNIEIEIEDVSGESDDQLLAIQDTRDGVDGYRVSRYVFAKDRCEFVWDEYYMFYRSFVLEGPEYPDDGDNDRIWFGILADRPMNERELADQKKQEDDRLGWQRKQYEALKKQFEK